jgi:hypothetical protein
VSVEIVGRRIVLCMRVERENVALPCPSKGSRFGRLRTPNEQNCHAKRQSGQDWHDETPPKTSCSIIVA